MIKYIFFLFSLFCLSCSSDNIIRSEKTDFYNIYKDIIIRGPVPSLEAEKKEQTVYNREWLSKFNQPIILLSSLDGKNTAILVILGNYQNKLTWVSSDGISISFKDGILIATRGYSQDLIEAQHEDLDKLFTQNILNRFKTYRFLNGKNRYEEMKFSCSLKSEQSRDSKILNVPLKTTKFIESCQADDTRHTNEYYVLPNTNIVIKSKQWISKANGYVIIHNYYAFQNNLL